METRQLNFDVARGGIQHRLFVRVGDANSRTIVARMYSGREAIAFSSAQLRILHADGKEFLGECEVDGNSATYTLTTDDIGNGGEILAEFIISASETAYMTSPRFAIVCEPLLYDGEGIEGTNEYQAYITALVKVDEALVKINKLSADIETADEPSVNVGVNEDGGIRLQFALPKGNKGDDGASVTVKSVDESSESGGENIVEFSDGNKLTIKNGADGHTPEKGVDYFTPSDIVDIFMNSEQNAYVFGGIWSFDSETQFEDNKWHIFEDKYFVGNQNGIIFIEGVPRYFWDSRYTGSGSYIPFASPMLDSEKEALKAYTDEKIGDIDSVLEELHAYANKLVGGDA